jgi:hypothetical protein
VKAINKFLGEAISSSSFSFSIATILLFNRPENEYAFYFTVVGIDNKNLNNRILKEERNSN